MSSSVSRRAMLAGSGAMAASLATGVAAGARAARPTWCR